ncbi:MAG: flagellar protein G [Halodesulfurarchaeum sp.]
MAIVSSETLIIFIAAILVATSVAGVLTTGVSRMSNAMDERSIEVAQDIRTDIEVISDPASDAVYSDGTITLLVKNTGSRTLSRDPDTIDVLVNGEYQTDVSAEVVGPDQTWSPGAVLRVTVQSPGLSGTNRVTIVVEETQHVFEFHV